MIILCGVEGFSAGPWTVELASRFAEAIGAELQLVDGGPAEQHAAAAAEAGHEAMIFGHAPARNVAAAFRAAPCPVVVAPAGVARDDWSEVILGCLAGRDSKVAAATAGALARGLRVPLRFVAVQGESKSTRWRPLDELPLLHAAAAGAYGPDLTLQADLRHGQPASALRAAASERGSPLTVMAADPRPNWFNLRPSVAIELIHGSRDIIVVVPPASAERSVIHASRDSLRA